MNDEQVTKYKQYTSNWIDEPIRFLQHNTKGQLRKIISEFYSSKQSTRWPDNVVPYEISPELSKININF